MRIPKFLREYGLAAIVALVCGLASAGAFTYFQLGHSYAPVEMRHIRWQTAQPFHVGQQVTITNGVCNTSEDTLQVTTVIGFKEAAKDTLAARKLVISPKVDSTGLLGVQPLAEPMLPGCVGIKDGVSEPITGPLPADLAPGNWVLYVLMTIDGPDGQRQKLTETSPVFTVVP